MGTRADYYIGRGLNAKWLGSTAWDGFPDDDRIKIICASLSEQEYLYHVERNFEQRDDATRPEQGWPWPWETSSITDYAYAWDGDRVWISCFGRDWVTLVDTEKEGFEYPEEKSAVFPNMKEIQKITFGERSGVMIFRAKE